MFILTVTDQNGTTYSFNYENQDIAAVNAFRREVEIRLNCFVTLVYVNR
jgi:hypothetical protein